MVPEFLLSVLKNCGQFQLCFDNYVKLQVNCLQNDQLRV